MAVFGCRMSIYTGFGRKLQISNAAFGRSFWQQGSRCRLAADFDRHIKSFSAFGRSVSISAAAGNSGESLISLPAFGRKTISQSARMTRSSAPVGL